MDSNDGKIFDLTSKVHESCQRARQRRRVTGRARAAHTVLKEESPNAAPNLTRLVCEMRSENPETGSAQSMKTPPMPQGEASTAT